MKEHRPIYNNSWNLSYDKNGLETITLITGKSGLTSYYNEYWVLMVKANGKRSKVAVHDNPERSQRILLASVSKL